MIRRSTTVQFLAAIMLVVAYSGVLVAQGVGGDETFPVFKWELFSKVPNRTEVDYGFRIVEVDGNVLFYPKYFEQARDYFGQTNSPDVTHLSRSVGFALNRDDQATAEDRRRRFEARFLAGHDVTYEVVERRYDTLARAACFCYRSEKVLATYSYDGRSS